MDKAEIEQEHKEVLKWAAENSRRVTKHGIHHIKIAGVNYYPSKATFNLDNQPNEPGRGAADFISFVESRTVGVPTKTGHGHVRLQ